MNTAGNSSFPAPGSGQAELKKRYRELIKRYHPDRNPDQQDWSTRMMQELNAAYDILREKRKMSSPLPKPWPRADIRRAIADGDAAVSQAVIKGWLTHAPRDSASARLRQAIVLAAAALKTEEGDRPVTFEQEYFHTLFSLFIRTTDPDIFLPFAGALNSTRFFRLLAQANRRLAAGMHGFYSSQGRASFLRLARVASSDLEDARRLYSALLLESRQRGIRVESRLESRLELADLFPLRLEDPRLRS
jgi:curved DNA-binding protein CbpA